MNEPRRCPVCGTDLPVGAPEGLCPKCLLQAGLASKASEPGSSQATAPFSGSSGFVPPAPATLAALFPQLEILELLGQGGMGAVYKARQPGLDRLVALKILPPEVAADPAFAERFTREARALARLNHPNIVGVYDFGKTTPVAHAPGSPSNAPGSPSDAPGSPSGLYYFLMEFVDGVNLRQAIRRGDLQPAEALKIVPQICDALQFAHDEGIVHRDIKPENILLDKRGRVKIADFGLAKLLGVKTDYALTGTRQVMGTPHYMAPEQIQGTRDVDHRADIYSLGVTFYEMLTGELPLGRFPLPSKKVQIDVRLDEVVLRTLEVEPEKRYQHASEVKTEVENIAGGARPPAPAPAGRSTPQQETMERTIADLLPEDKVAAVRIYREATGAGLAEAMSAVRAIAQKHGKDTPVPFSWEHFIWCMVWAAAAIAGGFWLAETQNNFANKLMFRLGGIVGALFAVAMQLSWQNKRSRWSLEDFDDEETEPEVKAPPPPAAPPVVAPVAPVPWPKLVVVFGIFNLLVAIMIVALESMELLVEPAPDDIFVQAAQNDLVYRIWTRTSGVLHYLAGSALFVSGIGLLLGRGWARRVAIGVCWFELASLVIEMPFIVKYILAPIFANVPVEAAELETSEEALIAAFVIGMGIMVVIGVGYLVAQMVVLNRPSVIAAFEQARHRLS